MSEIVCSKCGESKDEVLFGLYAAHSTGRRPDCRACRAEVSRAWSSMEEERTGKAVHVDHIYPLNSPIVCGLHVEDNLRLLFAGDNIAKGNRMPQLGEASSQQ